MTTISSSKMSVEEMLWTSKQPANLNYLRTNGFLFMIANMPKVSYFCQAANIPSLTLGVAEQPTPLLDIPHPGEKLTFGELSLRFMISEDLTNFMELYTWLFGLGHPLSTDQFKDYVQSQAFRFPQIGQFSEGPQFSDATLLVLDANNNPVAQFNFVDCFPTSISDMNFNISSGEAVYFQATATFKYLYYVVQSLIS